MTPEKLCGNLLAFYKIDLITKYELANYKSVNIFSVVAPAGIYLELVVAYVEGLREKK